MKHNYVKLFEEFDRMSSIEDNREKFAGWLEENPDTNKIFFVIVDGKIEDYSGFVATGMNLDLILDRHFKNVLLDLHGEELEEKFKQELEENGEDPDDFAFDPMLDEILTILTESSVPACVISVDRRTGEITDVYDLVGDQEILDEYQEEIESFFPSNIVERWMKMKRGEKMFGI